MTAITGFERENWARIVPYQVRYIHNEAFGNLNFGGRGELKNGWICVTDEKDYYDLKDGGGMFDRFAACTVGNVSCDKYKCVNLLFGKMPRCS